MGFTKRHRAVVGPAAAAAAFALLIALPAGSSAQADTGASSSFEVGGDESLVYPASPREITWQLESTTSGTVEVALSEVGTGSVRELTGEQARVEGASITIYPPALEAGTYVLTWNYPTWLGKIEGSRAVHIGLPTGVVPNGGERLAGSSPVLGFVLLLAGAFAAMLGGLKRAPSRRPEEPDEDTPNGRSDGNTRKGSTPLVRAGLAMVGVVYLSIAAVLVSTSSGAISLVGSALCLGAALALLPAWRGPSRALGPVPQGRAELWAAVLGGVAGGLILGGAGQWAVVSGSLGAAGGACLAVFFGLYAAHVRKHGDVVSYAAPRTAQIAVLGAGSLLLFGAVALSLNGLSWAGGGIGLPPVVLLGAVMFMLGIAFAARYLARKQDSSAGDSSAHERLEKQTTNQPGNPDNPGNPDDADDPDSRDRRSPRKHSRSEGQFAPVLAVGASCALLVLGLLGGVIAPSALAGTDAAYSLPASAQATAPECLLGGNFLEQATCLDYVFSAKARQYGPARALDELARAQEQVPQLRAHCHEASHAIGRATVASNGGSIAEAFEAGYDVCDFGYYHGVIEGAAGGLSDEQFLSSAPSLCAELASSTPALYFQCFHGIGHAAARRTNNDINRGLEMCNAIRSASFVDPGELDGALNGCGTGVTMEWFSIAQKAGLEFVEPRVADIKDVCGQVGAQWEEECVEYLANTLDTSRPRESLDAIVSWCQENTAQMEACLRGVARTAAALKLPISDVVSLCERSLPSSSGCIESYLIYLSTTVEFNLASIELACANLDGRYRDGSASACARAFDAAEGVLSSLDGKPESFAGRATAAPSPGAAGN